MNAKVGIIGGGVAGLTAAIGLHKLGIRAQVFERVQLLRGIGAGFGLAANAMQAFDYLGLRAGVEQIGHFLPSYNILDQHGKVLVSPSTGDITENYHQKNFSIHRGDLHQFLLAQLPADAVTLGKEAIRVSKKEQTVVVHFADGSSIEVEALIVADGVKSPIRQQLIPSSKPRYSGYTCWRAIIDNSVTNINLGTETWGAKGRFGMTPLVNNKLYWYACINAAPNSHVYRNFQVADLRLHFNKYHSAVGDVLAHTADEDLLWNDIIDIKPLRNLADGRIVYMGDAGHATTPNLGQGACQAIEDVAVLVDELRCRRDFVEAFQNFNRRRLMRTRYITNTSWQIGKIAQWENPLSIAVRNTAMRILPEKIKQIQLRRLLKEDFMSINKR